MGGAQAIAALAARHRERSAGRRDRRARQPLRDRGQAAARRAGRDRRDRRAERADRGRRRDRGPRAGSRSTSAPRPSTATTGCWSRSRRPGAARPDRRAGRGARPERPSVADAPLALVAAPGLERRAGSPTRSRPSTSSSPSRAPTRRPPRGPGRRLRVRRLGRGDGVRRLRRRARTTCCRPVAPARFGGPARPGRVHAPDLGRPRSSPRRRRSWRPTSTRSRAEGFPVHGESARPREGEWRSEP